MPAAYMVPIVATITCVEKTMKRVAIFVDGPSNHAASRALGIDIDYKKIDAVVAIDEDARVVSRYYYTAVEADNDGFSSLKPLLDYLSFNGWCVTTVPVRRFPDGDAERVLRPKMHVDMAVDMLRLVYRRAVDEVWIFSGDGDLVPLTTEVMQCGVVVKIVSTKTGRSPMVSDALRSGGNNFIDLDALRNEISRPQNERRQRRTYADDVRSAPRDPEETDG